MSWQLGVLTTSPDLSVGWLCRVSNRRRSGVDVVGKLTQVVTDSADVLGSRFDLERPPDVIVRDTAKGCAFKWLSRLNFEYLYGHLPQVDFHHRALLACYQFYPVRPPAAANEDLSKAAMK